MAGKRSKRVGASEKATAQKGRTDSVNPESDVPHVPAALMPSESLRTFSMPGSVGPALTQVCPLPAGAGEPSQKPDCERSNSFGKTLVSESFPGLPAGDSPVSPEKSSDGGSPLVHRPYARLPIGDSPVPSEESSSRLSARGSPYSPEKSSDGPYQRLPTGDSPVPSEESGMCVEVGDETQHNLQELHNDSFRLSPRQETMMFWQTARPLDLDLAKGGNKTEELFRTSSGSASLHSPGSASLPSQPTGHLSGNLLDVSNLVENFSSSSIAVPTRSQQEDQFFSESEQEEEMRDVPSVLSDTRSSAKGDSPCRGATNQSRGELDENQNVAFPLLPDAVTANPVGELEDDLHRQLEAACGYWPIDEESVVSESPHACRQSVSAVSDGVVATAACSVYLDLKQDLSPASEVQCPIPVENQSSSNLGVGPESRCSSDIGVSPALRAPDVLQASLPAKDIPSVVVDAALVLDANHPYEAEDTDPVTTPVSDELRDSSKLTPKANVILPLQLSPRSLKTPTVAADYQPSSFGKMKAILVVFAAWAKEAGANAKTDIQAKGLGSWAKSVATESTQTASNCVGRAATSKVRQLCAATGAFMAKDDFRATAASAAAGMAVIGAGGAAAGLAAGGVVGAAAAIPLAPFTLGLSIPVGAAIGSGAGLVVGTSAGAATGTISGGAIGYSVYRNREAIRNAMSTMTPMDGGDPSEHCEANSGMSIALTRTIGMTSAFATSVDKAMTSAYTASTNFVETVVMTPRSTGSTPGKKKSKSGVYGAFRQ